MTHAGEVAERRRLGESCPVAQRGVRTRTAAGGGARAVRHALFAAAVLAGVLAVTHEGPGYLRSAALLINAAGIEGWPHTVASWRARPFRTEARFVPSRHGDLRARLYAPEGRPERVFLMAPGVHAAGLDEPRLVDFAGHLASRGFAVLTLELPDLRRYQVTPRSTDMIEDAASWLAASSGLAEDGRVGIIGVSFAGGLGVVAAGRPALRDRVALVLSLGGHGDLSRTLRYLCTGLQPDGTLHPPHDYGVAVALLAVVDRLVPAAQAEALRQGVGTFLQASELDATDKPRAGALFNRARQMEREMPEPAATILRHVNRREANALGPILLHQIPALAADPALSPERSPAPAAPTYLLHGTLDNVIPAQESDLLARHLRGRTRVELLVTPLITHAEVRPSTDVTEVWKLVSFWRDLLEE